MTTLSNLNIVIQHGESGREAQNIKNQAVEASQVTTAQQEKEAGQMKTVQESDKSEKIKDEKEGPGNRESKEKKKKKKKKQEAMKESPDGTGKLLDTVA